MNSTQFGEAPEINAAVADQLLYEIVHCPNVAACLQQNHASNPCRAIVRSQCVDTLASFHIPEPWSGRLRTAPILFLGSNPSFSVAAPPEVYPSWSWAHARIEEYFTNRFGGGRTQWTTGGVSYLRADASYSPPVAFWAGVRRRAMELLEGEVEPGVDYALSGVVHCKSRGEDGVRGALQECAKRYLVRVISSSAARVIVLLGSVAKQAFANSLAITLKDAVTGPSTLATDLG